MKISNLSKNNRGFSLIELIVILAIISIAAGSAVLSVSLVTGSEAKKAFSKLDAQLNEVKTETMSRYDETLTVKYQSKGELDVSDGTFASTDEQEQEGYYGIKDVWTLTKSTSSGAKPVDSKAIGRESRMLCDEKVKITLWYGETKSADPDNWKLGLSSFQLTPNANQSIVFQYDRATGILKEAHIISAGTDSVVKPQFIEFESGMRSYRIEFIEGTGKHKGV